MLSASGPDTALVLGLTIGLAAGVSPGPLLLLVLVQTLRSGWHAGVLTAAAPLVSDAVLVWQSGSAVLAGHV